MTQFRDPVETRLVVPLRITCGEREANPAGGSRYRVHRNNQNQDHDHKDITQALECESGEFVLVLVQDRHVGGFRSLSWHIPEPRYTDNVTVGEVTTIIGSDDSVVVIE